MEWCDSEWSFELGLYWSTVYRLDEFIPCDRAELGRSTCPWAWNFIFHFGIPVLVPTEKCNEQDGE